MAIRIEDGLGSGKTAGVDNSNRLKTVAVTQGALSEQTTDGKAFVVYGQHTIQSSNVEKLFYLRNGSSTKNIEIHRIQMSVTTDGYDTTALIYASFDPIYVSGGTQATPLNLNRLSGITSEAVCYTNGGADLVYTSYPSKVFMRLGINKYCPTHVFDPDGAIILGPNSRLAMCGSGTSGQGISLAIYYTEAVEL
jgi:hypothetical protein